jgi:hypothetical protein
MCLLAAAPIEAANAPQAPTVPKQLHDTARPGAPETDGATIVVGQDAQAVHKDLEAVLKKYPPAVGRVIRMDPSLMTNPGYLGTYPALQTFLAAHPDVVKNPEYFFDDFNSGYRQPGASEALLSDLMGGLAGLIVFGTIVALITWLIRVTVDYRRWNRLAKVQAEAHTKLLDRFTANDELIAYVQSPAGSRFLESAPIALDPGTRRLGAPVSRILWSAQAGLVVMLAGLALQYVSGHVDLEAQQPLFAIGTVALAIGVGFLLSAVVSYALSHRLGLFDAERPNAPAPPMGHVSTHGPGA